MNANASRTSIYAMHSVMQCDCCRIFPCYNFPRNIVRAVLYYTAGMNESKNECAFAARSAHRKTDFST